MKSYLISPSESTMAEQKAMEAKHLLAKYHFSPTRDLGPRSESMNCFLSIHFPYHAQTR